MKFRKKPLVVEAWQVPPKNDEAWLAPPSWLRDALHGSKDRAPWAKAEAGGAMFVRTQHGWARAAVGDWIVCGVVGELYPCQAAVFEQTYEPAEA